MAAWAKEQMWEIPWAKEQEALGYGPKHRESQEMVAKMMLETSPQAQN